MKMSLAGSFKEQCIILNGKASSKEEVLAEIAECAAKEKDLSAYKQDEIRNALEDREQIGTTGFGDGIAIPHCSLEKAEGFVVGLYTSEGGVDFDAIDGKPVHLFFFIIGRAAERNRHILLLSTVSKILQQEQSREDLMTAHTAAGVRTVIERFSKDTEAPINRDKSLFHVVVQREDFFNDILQLFSSVAESSVTVIETNNAGKYLNRLPLFSALWTSERSAFNRLIIAAVDKSKCNDIIRRIHLISDEINREPGILITVHDLAYTGGSIDF